MIVYKVQLHRGKFAMVWREAGRIRRFSLGTTDKETADRLAREAAEEIEKAEAATYNVAQIWEAYRETLVGKPAHVTMGYEAKALMPTFGHLMPAHISEPVVQSYIEARRRSGLKDPTKGVSDGTIRTELIRLGGALNYGVKRGWIARVPTLPLPPVTAPRDRYLTKAEAARYLDAIKQPYAKLFVILALSTGARSEALLSLTWDRVDLERRRIQLTDPTETRRMKGRALVPINATAHAALVQANATARAPFVISYRGGRLRSVKRPLRLAVEASGVEGVTPHVFRHTAAVWMAEARVPMQEIAQFLGHRDYKVTERVYARFSPDFLQGAARALDFSPSMRTKSDGKFLCASLLPMRIRWVKSSSCA